MPGTFFGLALLVSSVGGAYAAEPVLIPVLIPEWKVVGPFESGSREGFVHNLAGVTGRIPRRFTYTETYPSVLADGGRVGWKSVPADRDESGALTARASLKLDGVDWDSREKEWGGAALLNVAYASATVALPSAGLYLLEASRCSVTLNGVSIAGDPYGQGIAQSVVRGRAWDSDILVTTSGYGGERAFELKLTPMPAGEFVRIIEKDVLLPDLVENVDGNGFVGVPLISAQETWQPGLRILIDGAMTGSVDVPASLPPLGSLKVAVPVHWNATARPEGEAGSVDVRIRVIRASISL